MVKVKEKLSNGRTITYNRLENGTCYNAKTNLELVGRLDSARRGGARVRLFYGDTSTGKDWHEEHDITGKLGRSTGTIKIPILLNNSRSSGGPAILDYCIVKLMINGSVRWQHPKYNAGLFTVGPGKDPGHTTAVYIDEVLHAQFRTPTKAQRWIDFMTGKRLSK
ncbi:MAG: hypothetical protein WC294_00215 [Methanoregula sp.]|jgi:hypothetical protein